jgi:Na+-translocating ferredoxin:NAD+ oxidoreductase RnfC subunit
MSVSLQRLEEMEVPELSVTIRNAGVAGAGGAGFPSYAKWEHAETVDHLLVNHQESEPDFFMDKWLGREHAEEFATLFDALLDRVFETVVVAAKEKDRERWMGELEAATDPTVYLSDDLPVDPDEESGVVFAYTDDRYEYGMESVLLRMVGGVTIGNSLPMDYGWIVQNTETLYNIYRTLDEGVPVTHKFLHVDGEVPNHRFLEAPIGTPAADLLAAAGLPVEDLPSDAVLADGGPGWCFAIDRPPEAFGIRKRTNCLLVLEEETVESHTLGNGRINVLDVYRREEREMETEPTATLRPEYVRIPLISNPAFEGVVSRSEPIVDPGERVEEGEMVATPSRNGIGIPQHASIDGEVTEVTDDHVEIRRAEDGRVAGVSETEPTGESLYWTWCMECGTYALPPLDEPMLDPTRYVCEDCR